MIDKSADSQTCSEGEGYLKNQLTLAPPLLTPNNLKSLIYVKTKSADENSDSNMQRERGANAITSMGYFK